MLRRHALVVAIVVVILAAACAASPTISEPATPDSAAPFAPAATAVDLGTACGDARSCLVLLGTVIDGTGAAALPNAALVIQGERVIAVGPRNGMSIPAQVQVIELGGATILPGFINAHVHNAYKEQNLRLWAQQGVTTVRDLGERLGFPYFSTRDRLRADLQNAWLIAAGPLVTVPKGYPIAGNNFPSLTVTSPEDAREKISRLIEDGADLIKITLTSGGAPSLSAAEATAIVETAHAQGVPVSAHATSVLDVQRALDAGVDDVAHLATDRVSDRLIQQMVQTGVYWVPTLEALRGRGAENLQRFVAAGGHVALGNDGGYLSGLEIGMPMAEIRAMHRAGMTPAQIIVASTRDAAHVCRQHDTLGTLEAGKFADVLVVDGNPLDDPEALANVRMVIHRGVVIRDERPAN